MPSSRGQDALCSSVWSVRHNGCSMSIVSVPAYMYMYMYSRHVYIVYPHTCTCTCIVDMCTLCIFILPYVHIGIDTGSKILSLPRVEHSGIFP